MTSHRRHCSLRGDFGATKRLSLGSLHGANPWESIIAFTEMSLAALRADPLTISQQVGSIEVALWGYRLSDFHTALGLADAILAAPPEDAANNLRIALQKRGKGWVSLASRLMEEFAECWHDRSRYRIARAIQDSRVFRQGCQIRRYSLDRAAAPPRPTSLVSLSLPEFSSLADLENWLGLAEDGLSWMTRMDCHYFRKWVPKRRHGQRLLEIPKTQLRKLQRHLLKELLNQVPLHPGAHGFCRGRSYLTNARLHVGQPVVVNFDLQDFFLNLTSRRVQGVFTTLGYRRSVARALTALCTTSVKLPQAPISWELQKKYATPHLPQGAPTSPTLANLCCHRLDCRLQGLAEQLGGHYSRYADDLTFSVPNGTVSVLTRLVPQIAEEEGLGLNHRKTCVMRASRRQMVTGLVVNRFLNLRRRDYDQLKAILHNCRTHGPQSQTREAGRDLRAHLLGRISQFRQVHPSRGERLLALLNQVSWAESGSYFPGALAKISSEPGRSNVTT